MPCSYVCVYVCVCVVGEWSECILVCMCVYVLQGEWNECILVYVCVCGVGEVIECILVHMSVRMCVCVYMCAFICVCVGGCVCACVCVCVCARACACVYMAKKYRRASRKISSTAGRKGNAAFLKYISSNIYIQKKYLHTCNVQSFSYTNDLSYMHIDVTCIVMYVHP